MIQFFLATTVQYKQLQKAHTQFVCIADLSCHSRSSHKRKSSGAEIVSVTGAGRLQECLNTEFELEFKQGFVKAAISRAVHL